MELKPGALIIKRITDEDIAIARQLFLVLQKVFEVEKPTIVNDGHSKKLLKNQNFICFAAIYNDQVIGGLTAYELPMYNSELSEIFIYDIAVNPKFQRMGIGKKLMEAIKQYANQNGIKQLFVDANEADEHALNFYRSMNAKEEKVVQFTYSI